MDFYASARKHEDKLSEILGEHNFRFKFQTDQYPITLTISQSQDVGAQMEIYSNAEGSISSMDAILRYIFKLDDIEIQTSGRLVMDLKLMSKINGVVKKWDAAYKAAFFADVRRVQFTRRENLPEDDYDEDEEEDLDDPEEETPEEETEPEAEAGDFDGFFDDGEPEPDDTEEEK